MSEAAGTTFTSAGVRRGFLQAQPLAPGAFIYGMVFGVLASERGLAWLEALLMSIFVYSGSAQLAALQGWSNSPVIAPLVATLLLINARYVLYSASIQPWLAGATRTQALGSLFFLGDGNWALAMREYHAGYRDAGFVLGSGAAMALPWALGTLAGHVLGHSVPNPATFGLDFMLVGFAAAIGVGVWRGRGDVAPALVAIVVALAMHRWAAGTSSAPGSPPAWSGRCAMNVDSAFLVAVAAMAVTSYACRVAGYVLMGYIPITPRVQAALKAIPLGVMIGIVTPSVAAGRVPEIAGLAMVGAVMKLTRNDLAAALAGAAIVALCRWAGF